MKPPTRPRQDQSQSLIEKETVFKTQGQSYNMDDLIKSTLLKEPVLESIVPNIYEKVMTKAEVHLKNIITSAVAEAVTNAVKPLIDMIHRQGETITCLQQDNTTLRQDNANLRRDVIHLSEQIEELEQYGRRTSLRFHNVPIRDIDKQRTDNIIVDIVKSKMKMINFSVDDINRSHIIGNINQGKEQIICRLRNWKIKNSIYQLKTNLKSNADRIFVTEDLTKHRQSIVKELNIARKAKKISSFWTFDGRIFAKVTQESGKQLIKNLDDVRHLVR
jgi:FtsZ-binding cell division protein ZapB